MRKNNTNKPSTKTPTPTWKQVTKYGRYNSWIDYQKRVLGQVEPIKKNKP